MIDWDSDENMSQVHLNVSTRRLGTTVGQGVSVSAAAMCARVLYTGSRPHPSAINAMRVPGANPHDVESKSSEER